MVKPWKDMALVLLGCLVEEMTPATMEEAQCQIRQGISILEDRKLKLWSPVGYLYLGEFLANAGRKEEAMESLKKAEISLSRNGNNSRKPLAHPHEGCIE